MARTFPLAWLCVISLAPALMCLAQNGPQDYLAPHNAARKEVGVGPLIWDSTLEAYARKYAAVRSKDCKSIPSGGPYGENLYFGYGEGAENAADAVSYWVAEKDYYDHYENACVMKDCTHYTQVVWRNSTHLGCARSKCRDLGFFIVCSYNPPGNIDGKRPY